MRSPTVRGAVDQLSNLCRKRDVDQGYPCDIQKNVENPWKPQSKPMENPWKKHGFPFGKGSTSGFSHCRLSITCSFVYVWINGMKVAT